MSYVAPFVTERDPLFLMVRSSDVLWEVVICEVVLSIVSAVTEEAQIAQAVSKAANNVFGNLVFMMLKERS